MPQPNPELDLARAFVEETDCAVFLTGKAGTGKTTFLHRLKEQTGKRLVVTAPTGVAAINAGGLTLHSFFQLPFGPLVPGAALHDGRHRVGREKRNLMQSLDLLVIDEISMVRADLLDGVDAVLKRYRRSELPFGGVQLLMIGDLHQLPPVVKEAEWQLLRPHYGSPYFFSSLALQRLELVAIELGRIFRQSDQRFIDLLAQVRDNRLDAAGLETLNARCRPGYAPEEGVITLCTHNRQADAINAARLDALPVAAHRFTAEIEGNFPEYAYPTAADLELKPGAQVMFVRNDTSPEKRFFNGKIGTVDEIGRQSVRVVCPGDDGPIEVGTMTWENIDYAVDAETAEITPKVVGSFQQIPLKPAWAITIHKSQGLTFDRVAIDAQAAFAHGQVYVGLSRCRSLDGLVLSSPLAARTVAADPAVRDFVARAAARPPTAADLAVARIRYQQKLLLACFDFSALAGLLGRLTGLLRHNAGIVQVNAVGDVFAIRQQAQDAICAVGDRFQLQLQSLFAPQREPAADPVVRERLAKAGVYFAEQFAAGLGPCIESLEVASDNKEIRKRIEEFVKLLRQECAGKQAAIRVCAEDFSPGRYLRALSVAAMAEEKRPKPADTLYTEADVGHPALFRALRQWRNDTAATASLAPYQVMHQKTLIQIAIHQPDSMEALQSVKGIGKRLAERYGREILALVADWREADDHGAAIPPSPSAIGPTGAPKRTGQRLDTKAVSLEMLQTGLSLPEIADQRGLTLQTVEGHLAYFVKNGTLPLAGLLAPERIRELEDKIRPLSASSLKALKIALGDSYSFGEINLVLAHLQAQDNG
ncbi:MAG: HRDC domain-containing protein [Desulfobulbus sp.]|uniref:helix-turn-helix domain-containing protein n=1 Tax=Desulfobulbus sp. TaxID=895 RepID=UPI0028476C4C|nr:HRDC domain-containing protein [Desulfobulbus sp.]MDR2550418.1 HRDC domain-containing protein [Desulfobulbus sp.]